ncbi:hypothetical protein QAD02_009396 [Eretmocerus hayati]|uniref:Uncharacterized protein n=1 Tax=Eretmocerus hayati TaxID=131215 RepID=A0ACC2N9C9_9HYME|nr:hypothetical protein QAD02_009396 [Eretmocerus hayati]
MDVQKCSSSQDSIPGESKIERDQRLYAQLKLAVCQGQKDKIDSLLEEGSPVNGNNSPYFYEFRTPLHSAVHLGDPEIVEKLLSKGASVDLRNVNGETALTLAAKIRKHTIVDLLLMSDGLSNSHSQDEVSHLHIACMRNNVGVVKKLIHQSRANINAAVQDRSLREEKETKKATNKYKIVIRKGITWIREDISYWIRRVTGYGSSAYGLEELSKKGITTNKGAWVLKTDRKDLKDKLLSTMIRKGEKAYVVEEFMNATQRWKEKEKRKGLQAMIDNGYTIKEEKGRKEYRRRDKLPKDEEEVKELTKECIETVQYLLDIGADITIKDSSKLTPLHLADMYRSEQIIDMILSVHTDFVSNPVSGIGTSHFHIACTRNNTEVVNFFIKLGVDFKETGGTFHYSCLSAIDLAIYYNCVDVVKLLLSHGDNVKSYLPVEIDRIEYAYDSGNIDLVNVLLTKSKNVSIGNPAKTEKIPALHHSCIHGKIETIKQSFSNTPGNLNVLWNGVTPLHLAIERRDSQIFEFLVKQGADYSIKNNNGKSPLHLAFERNVDFIMYRSFGNLTSVSRNPVTNYGLSHLHILCTSNEITDGLNQQEAVEKSIVLGFDINSSVNLDSPIWAGFTPLHFAALFRCVKAVRVLLLNGACYTAVDKSRLSAFDLSVQNTRGLYDHDVKNSLKIMEAILSSHSNHQLSPFNDWGYSLLHLLSLNPKTRMITMKEFIKRHPLDIHKTVSKYASTFGGYSPLHFAMKFGNKKHATLLLKLGANILCEDANGDTPLHLAFESDNHMELPSLHLNCCTPSHNSMGSSGLTLFHIACGMGNVAMMNYFLRLGVIADLPTILKSAPFYDKKPLHMVVHKNPAASVEVVKLLIDNGANVDARDSRLCTPLHLMRNNQNTEIIDLLVSHGADVNALNANFETPLLCVSMNSLYADVEKLYEKVVSFLNNGADINLADEDGTTPLNADTWTDEDSSSGIERSDFAKTVDFLLKHVLKLEMIGFHVSDTNKKAHSKLVDYFSDEFIIDQAEYKRLCTKELESMINIHTDNYTTLHDILFKNPNETAVLSQNEMFIQIVNANDFQEKFPIYGFMLKSQLIRGRVRRPLLIEAQKILNFLSCTSLPQSCTEIILQPLTNEDLRYLIISKNMQNTI